MGGAESKPVAVNLPGEIASKGIPRTLDVSKGTDWGKPYLTLSDPESGASFTASTIGDYKELLLHAGPDKDSSVMSKITHNGKWCTQFHIALPNGQYQVQLESKAGKGWYRFSFPTKNGNEGFEWRRAKGSLIAGLGLSDHGWELVRMANREVVAIWADPSALNPFSSKVGKLQFVNSGGSGELGALWSVMAVTSVLCTHVKVMLQMPGKNAPP